MLAPVEGADYAALGSVGWPPGGIEVPIRFGERDSADDHLKVEVVVTLLHRALRRMAGLVFLLVFWVLASACQRRGLGVFVVVVVVVA